MSFYSLTFSENKIFSLFSISSLAAALFYTGNNTWLFTTSYIFIIFSFALVLKQRFYQSISVSINGILISSVLLLSWFAISIFFSQIKYLSLYNFFWVGSLIIVFLTFTLNENKDHIWKNIWPYILLLVFIWAIYGLVQYYYLHVPSNASFLNRNSLAALINLALIPAVGYFLLKQQDRPWRFLNNRLLTFILLVLFLSVFIITSRGASISLFLGLMVVLALLWKHVEKEKIYKLLLIIFSAFLLSIISQYFITDLPMGFADRMVTLSDTDTVGNNRYVIWKSLFPLFEEMPWYGFGLGSLWVFWAPYRPPSETSAGFFAHNDYMQITIESGYPGIFLLVLLFVFIFLRFIKALKNLSATNNPGLSARVEIITLFSALLAFATHSLFTYNFYILPLLIVAGLYLGRFHQLTSLSTDKIKTIPAFNLYFKKPLFIFCLSAMVFVLSGYFIALSLSSHYNIIAKELMLKNKYQESNDYFLKAQTLAPLMDNPYFSHADLLRRGANQLISVNKLEKANSLLKYAHENLDVSQKLNPFRAQSHHIRALIYERKEPEKAKIEFIKALKLDPRFLFARIRLAQLLHKESKLKQAMEVLYDGVNYNYPVNNVMLEYMQFFAKLSREAGVESFALHLESNIKQFLLAK